MDPAQDDARPAVAELPETYWQPPPPEQPRNSPFAVFGILVVVLAIVGGVALLGSGSRTIEGHALPAPAGGSNREQAPADGTPGKKAAAVYELGTNPLLNPGVGLPQITCRLPAIKRTPEALREYYQAEVGCLDTAWKAALEQVNEPFEPTELEIEVPSSSACGAAPSKEEATAYYCGGDRTIYMPRDRLLEDAGVIQSAHLALLAHEYAHHVQELSGIMGALEDKEREITKGTPEDLELGRRLELQANCFAGMFIAAAAGRGSVSKSLADKAMIEFGYVEDSDSHGTRQHQVKWARAGFDGKHTSACNTWTAPAGDVR
ncbi:neutral zinc metallopeptidase [Amycolatopsis anabasis]|uniref:neutral zinc metallopeptidase n=1 Tax=Amycolatopsis anabasis TaxID=1840409 RepID=UPI00131AE3D4|nr:neutral zinc metallopeptidase [Amycolatopsis anabasis]